MKRLTFFILACIAFTGSAFAQSQEEVDAIVHGEGLAKLNCSRCHAIGLTGDSLNPDAPAFRTLAAKRNIPLIGWELMNKEWGKHRKMPQFEITADQVRDILVWINWVQPVAHGERLVTENCSRCHAIGLDDESSHPGAVPFRNLSTRYQVDALEEAFAEGIDTGHPDMPTFDASIEQVRSILAYINTIQQPKAD